MADIAEHNSIPRLKIQLLGAPEVCVAGRPVTFPARKALALLAYLAVESTVQTRDHLADLLWPESPPHRARAVLRNGLHQLRTTLGELGEDDFLRIERDTLAFDTSADYSLDLQAVDRILQQPPQPDTHHDWRQAWQHALELCRGEFMAGFTLEDAPDFTAWLQIQRTAWHGRVDRLFALGAQAQIDHGDVAQGIQTVTRWLAHNPLSEPAYQCGMQCHLAAGDRSAALRLYEQCEAVLSAELDVTPGPETTALAAQARAANPSTAAQVAARSLQAASSPGINSAARAQPPAFDQGPLVGRAPEFGKLVTAYHRAAAGAPQAVCILGEAGIGKSRLAQEFALWAAAQGAHMVQSRGFESSRQVPYQLLVDALRPRMEAINAPEDYLSDTWLAELARLLPELRERYADLQPPTIDESTAQARLFEAVARFTVSLAQMSAAHSATRAAPLVCIFDDLQWADAASLQVLHYLSRHWSAHSAPIFLIVLARDEALHPLSVAHARHLADTLDDVESQLPTTTLTLETLSPDATGEFISAFGGASDSDLSSWLYTETQGQPFFLVATLETLRAQGLVQTEVDAHGQWHMHARAESTPHATDNRQAVAQHGRAHDIPARVRQLIANRLARLSPVAFDLLAAGAVLGQDLEFGALCQVAGTDEGDALRALDELLHSHLLREAVPARGPTTPPIQSWDATGSAFTPIVYSFAHDKILEVTYTEAGEARRRVFHRRALQMLRSQNGTQTPEWATLAYHARAAGEFAAAFDYAIAAGEESLTLFATRNAIAHYEQARNLGQGLIEHAGVDEHRLRHLYLQLGRSYELAGEYANALENYAELQRIAQARADPPLELAARMARATVLAVPNQYYDAAQVRVLEGETLTLARALGDHAAESKIHWIRMLIYLFDGAIADAVTAGEESLAIARAHDLQERMAYAHHDLTRACLFSGRPQLGFEHAGAAQELWRALDNKAMLSDILISTASTRFFWQGADPALIPLVEEGLALSKRIGNLWNQSYANHVLGSIYYILGDYGKALYASSQAIEFGRKAGFWVPLYTNAAAMAIIYADVGRPDLGFSWVERGLQHETDMQDQKASLLAAKAYLFFAQGDMNAAESWLAESYATLNLEGMSSAIFFTFPIAGRIRLAQSDYARAREAGRELYANLEARQLVAFRDDAYYIQAAAEWGLGNADAAWEAVQAARAADPEERNLRMLWEILLLQAELAQQRGDSVQAHALQAQAAQVIRRIAQSLEDIPALDDGDSTSPASSELRASFLARPKVRAALAHA